jgi:REP element-mobilizing transposase RayT
MKRAKLEPGTPDGMTPRTKREHLKQLVQEKGRWFRPLTDEERALGFLGWHERGHLPHCDYPGLVQLVTFRLADSTPASRRREWEHLLAIEDAREKRSRLEEYLDRGLGRCHLRDHRVAAVAENALRHVNGARHELLAWVVMPNHVHVLVHIWRTPLWKLVQNWKVHVENVVRRGRLVERREPPRRVSAADSGAPTPCPAVRAFWQREYWDTFMRDERQELVAIRYIENNPVKAGLCRTPEDWPFSSARFREAKTRKLVLPSSGMK